MPSPPLPPAILLMGPTASGKTAAALALADRFPVDLVSVDSAQVFRDMDIGTAKPDAETLARFPHRLIDLVTPEESYSAARFRADALAEMAAITAAGRVPLGNQTSVYGYVQLPLYQDVKGVQLVPRFTASIGLRHAF